MSAGSRSSNRLASKPNPQSNGPAQQSNKGKGKQQAQATRSATSRTSSGSAPSRTSSRSAPSGVSSRSAPSHIPAGTSSRPEVSTPSNPPPQAQNTQPEVPSLSAEGGSAHTTPTGGHSDIGGTGNGAVSEQPRTSEKRSRQSAGHDDEDDEEGGGLANAPNQRTSLPIEKAGIEQKSDDGGGSRMEDEEDDRQQEHPSGRDHHSDEEEQGGWGRGNGWGVGGQSGPSSAGVQRTENLFRTEPRAFDDEPDTGEEEEGEEEVDGEEEDDEFSRKEISISTGRQKKKKKTSDGYEDSNGTKVVESNFPSHMLSFAQYCKAFFRKEASFGSAFPPRDIFEREVYVYQLLLRAAKEEPDTVKSTSFLDTLDTVESKYPHLYTRLTTFAIYGKRQLLNSLINKSHGIIEMYYGFSSMDHAAICSRVAWLLEKGVFRYGGIKLETKEYDVQAPLATPLMSALIRAQWFDGTKGDRPAYHAIMKLKSIPKETVILCFTVTECVLKCWQGGSFTRVNFSEDNCSTRYNFFLDTWNELETNAPSYTKRILSQNFIRTLKHTKNSSLLHSEEDVRRDIVGINFEALNSLDGDLIS